MSLNLYLKMFLTTALGLLLATHLYGQGGYVSGTVYDTDGRTPVIGASVVVKGTTNGVAADVNGAFRIQASPNDVLVFQSLGFDTQEVEVGNRTTVNVIMKAQSAQIDEVVVTALGISREQKSLGYAVTKLSEDDLGSTGSGNWLSGMQGKVAGLNFDSASSGPGGSMRVTLRGEGSLSHDNNTALFVIDGIPVGSDAMSSLGGSSYSNTDAPVDLGNGAGDLNPDDIESISVLKGPSATALYGSRAGNGAIIITTKSGRTTKGIGVTVNSGVSFEKAGFWPDFQNEYGAGNGNSANSPNANGDDARRYYSFWNVPAAQSWNGIQNRRLQSRNGFGPRYEGQLFYQYDSYDWETGEYTRLPWVAQDWYKGFFDTGVTYTNSVSVDGSSGQGNNFRLSLKDVRNEWIVPNTGFNSQNISFSLGQKLNDHIRVNAKVTYMRKNSDNLPTTGYSQASPLYALIWNVPSVSVDSYYREWASGRIPELHAAGQGASLINNAGSARSENVYWLAYENLNTLDRDRVYGNISVTATLLPQLELTVRSGIDYNTDFTTQQKPQYSYGNDDGFYRERSTNRMEFNNDFLLTYNNAFVDDRLTMSATFGGNNMVYDYKSVTITADQLFIPNVFRLSNSTNTPLSNSRRTKKSVNSLYGVVSLGWEETYFLDITGRNDWSSTLNRKGRNNSFFYPSVTGSVLLDQIFNFRERAPWIGMLKVRGSWANVGNDTEPYRTTAYYSNSDFSGSLQLPTTITNENIKPENVESWEVGIEARMFRGRLTFDATYYNAITTDQIIPVPTDASSGVNYQIINAGKVRNRGIELSASVTAIDNPNFRWNISANWTQNWNKLIELAPGVTTWQLNSGTSTIGDRVYINAYPGTELGRIYGFTLRKAPEGSFYMDANGNRVDASGMDIVDRTTGNPDILMNDVEDMKDLGSIYPYWKGGMSHSFRYKNVTMNMTFTAQWGGRAYSVTHFGLAYTGKLKNTLPGRYEGLIHPGVNLNADGTYSKNETVTTDVVDYYSTYIYNRNNGENNTFDTSFFKMKELSVEYALPQRIVDKIGFLQGASLSFYATNLFCITSFPQYDPEAAASLTGGSISRGIETGGYPMTRTYGLNLKLQF